MTTHPQEMQISERELAALTSDLDEAHHATMPLMRDAIAELSAELRDATSGKSVNRRSFLIAGTAAGGALASGRVRLVGELVQLLGDDLAPDDDQASARRASRSTSPSPGSPPGSRTSRSGRTRPRSTRPAPESSATSRPRWARSPRRRWPSMPTTPVRGTRC